MGYSTPWRAVVFIAAISLLCSVTKAGGSPPTYLQSVSSAATKLGRLTDSPADIETLIQELLALTAGGAASYDAIRIVGQIGRLGPQASPAVDMLIDLLGKPFADCEEQLRVCPNDATNCVREIRTCPAGVEMRNYDYLTPYAFAALQQIGVAALPQLGLALDNATRDAESVNRRLLVARVMGSIGPAALPSLSEVLRASDQSKRRLALGAIYTVLSKDSSSGNQLSQLVPYIMPFLGGDFETTDQAIYILGGIGPDAAEAVPRLTQLLSYKRVLGETDCPVGERTGYIFQAGAIEALLKIGTPEAMMAVQHYKPH